MFFKDAYRAQYYITSLEKKLHKISEDFSSFSNLFSFPPREVFSDFITTLAQELDQLILPTLAYEISQAKAKGFLQGESSSERYKSFFVKDGKYTSEALAIIEKYPFLIELLESIVTETFKNASECLQRFISDRISIETAFDIKLNLPLKQLKIISSSDRHKGKQALLLVFTDGSKLIYKCADLRADLLFNQFVENLRIPFPYNLQCMKILPKKENYGWIEFISCIPCSTRTELENFYRRAGVLLAISDALNYTDGHCENVIAHKDYPYLLDGETFFLNYSLLTSKEKNVLSTLLIQKIKKNNNISKYGFYSGFQGCKTEKFHALYTYALNDHTDEINIHFRGKLESEAQNAPILNGQLFTAQMFIKELVEGFCFGYDHISSNIEKILTNTNWWNLLSSIRSRIILRHTIAYLYLLRYIQQPDLICSKRNTEKALLEKLGNNDVSIYEIADLLKSNIPYFYQIPGEPHLYDGNNECYPNLFPKSTIEILKEQFLVRSKKKKEAEVRLIEKHLNLSKKLSRKKC